MSEWTPGEEAVSGRAAFGMPAPPAQAVPPPPGPVGGAGRSHLAKRGAVAAAACLVVAGASIAIAGRSGSTAATSLSLKGTTATTQPSKAPPHPEFPGKLGGGGRHFLGGGGGGTVASVTSGGFTVTLFDGSKATFTTNSSTVYREGPVTVSRSALAVGQQVLVGATRPSKPSGSSNSSAPRPASVVLILAPEVAGKVVSISGSTLVLQDGQGFWRTVQLSGSTVYQSAGKASSISALKVGGYAAVAGNIAADHTTLDASAVEVLGTKPANGPDGRFGSIFGIFGNPGGPAAFFGGDGGMGGMGDLGPAFHGGPPDGPGPSGPSGSGTTT